jgi:hypothetical protein
MGRWRSALQSIEMVHGKAERDRVEAEMSKPVGKPSVNFG